MHRICQCFVEQLLSWEIILERANKLQTDRSWYNTSAYIIFIWVCIRELEWGFVNLYVTVLDARLSKDDGFFSTTSILMHIIDKSAGNRPLHRGIWYRQCDLPSIVAQHSYIGRFDLWHIIISGHWKYVLHFGDHIYGALTKLIMKVDNSVFSNTIHACRCTNSSRISTPKPV